MKRRSVIYRTELERRLAQDLHQEANRAFSDHADMWPEIDRKSRQGSMIRSLDSRSARHGRLSRYRKRTWWAAVLVAMMLAGGGAYAAIGLVGILDDTYSETVPYVHEHELGTPVEAEQSMDGVTVTVDRVYADSAYVAVGYTVDGLSELGDPSQISTDMKLLEPGSAADRRFEIADGYWSTLLPGEGDAPKGAEAGTVVFEASDMLQESRSHRLRAVVEINGPKGKVPDNGKFQMERLGQPFAVEFKIPVQAAPMINVDQTVEASGVPITLTRVVNSPAKTRAYLCFDPPRGKYDSPVVKTPLSEEGRLANAPVPDTASSDTEDGCAIFVFDEVLYGKRGSHSLTVNILIADDPKIAGSVDGPWEFRFEIPEPRLK